jgi:anti-anti-sigma factor
MAPQSLRFEVDRQGRHVTFRLTGKLFVDSLPALAKRVDEVEAEGVDVILFNFAEVERIDSRGIGALAGWHRHFAQRGKEFRLVRVSEEILHVLQVCNLAALITPDPSGTTPAGKLQRLSQSLFESHEYADQVLAALGEGLIGVDPQGHILFVNRCAVEMLRLNEQEALGEALFEVLASGACSNLTLMPETSHLDAVVRGEQPRWRGELELPRDTGTPGQVLSVIATVIHSGGSRAGSIIALMDITRLREAERDIRSLHTASDEAVAQSESIYRAAIENAAGVSYRLHFQSGLYEFGGDGIKALVGLPASGLSQSRLQELVGEVVVADPSAEGDPETYREDFRAGRLSRYQVDMKLRLPSGELKWISDSAVPLRDDLSGEVLGALGIFQDITDRKRAEEASRESERRFSEALAQADVIVYRLNCQTQAYDFIGDGIEPLLGYSPSEMSPSIWGDIVETVELHGNLAGMSLEEATERFQRGEIPHWRSEILVRTRSGEKRWLRDVSTATCDRSGRVVSALGLLQNVTAFRQTEEALKTTSRQEATARLAGGIAHDFNNLMVGVLGHASLIKEDIGPGHLATGLLLDIEKAAERASRLAQQLLAFARGGKYAPREVDLNAMIADRIEHLRKTVPPTIQVSCDLDPNLPPILADPTQMAEVVMSLCQNAVEAIERHGRVTITSRSIAFGPADTSPAAGLRPGRHALITVEDTGRGMDAQTQAQVFDPFFTTKAQGRGLGLAAVYGIVKNHGGHVTVHSTEGKGSTFRIYTPLKETVDEPSVLAVLKPSEEPSSVEASSSGPKTILVAEHEEAVLDETMQLLEKMGFDVLTARDGRQAVATARTHEGLIELALLDTAMPVMGAAEAMTHLSVSRPEMRVIVSSGDDQAEGAKWLLAAGAHEILSKPYGPEALESVIAKTLAG